MKVRNPWPVAYPEKMPVVRLVPTTVSYPDWKDADNPVLPVINPGEGIQDPVDEVLDTPSEPFYEENYE